MAEERLGTRNLFRLACLEVCRDGRVDPAERDLLQQLQQVLGLPTDLSREIFTEAREYCREQPSPEAGPLRPETLYDLACELAWADGALEDRERRILMALGDVLAIPAARGEEILLRHTPVPDVELDISVPELPRPASRTGRGGPGRAGGREASARRHPREEAPRTPPRLPPPPPRELGSRPREGSRSLVGWLSRAAGLGEGTRRAAGLANGFLRVLRESLAHLATAPDLPRATLVRLSEAMVTRGRVQSAREARRAVGDEACTPALVDPRILREVEQVVERAGRAAGEQRLLLHLTALWYALDALHAPRAQVGRLRPQYVWLAELVAKARERMPERLPPFALRILWYVARQVREVGEGDLADLLGADLCPGIWVVAPPGREEPGAAYAFPYADPPRALVDPFRSLDRTPRAVPQVVRELPLLDAANERGFWHLTYAAETRPGDGAAVRLSREHGGAVGRALRPSLRSFALQVTGFEEGAAAELAEAARDDLLLDELTLAKRSPDPLTEEEARALAALAAGTRSKVLHLWAGGYAEGALGTLAETLEALGAPDLLEVDVCDVTRPEDEERVRHPGLEALVAANAG